MASILETKILLRYDSADDWTNSNPVLGPGEVGIEYNEEGPAKVKIGDGITNWINLPYQNASAVLPFQNIDFNVFKVNEAKELTMADEIILNGGDAMGYLKGE